jgi:hypothetical protein
VLRPPANQPAPLATPTTPTTPTAGAASTTPTAPGAGSATATNPANAATPPGPGSAANGWQAGNDLPPAWVDRPLSFDGDTVHIVGHSPKNADAQTGLEAARLDAIQRLVDQLYTDLAGSPTHDFIARRVKADAARAGVPARFLAQHGKDTNLSRTEVASRPKDGAVEVYAQYAVPKAQYDQLLASYKSTAKFRGVEVAAFFPLLDTALHASGDLIVVKVDSRSPAELATLREGDIILKVGGTPMTSVADFRDGAPRAWGAVDPRYKLVFEVESAGATRSAGMIKPAPPSPTP